MKVVKESMSSFAAVLKGAIQEIDYLSMLTLMTAFEQGAQEGLMSIEAECRRPASSTAVGEHR